LSIAGLQRHSVCSTPDLGVAKTDSNLASEPQEVLSQLSRAILCEVLRCIPRAEIRAWQQHEALPITWLPRKIYHATCGPMGAANAHRRALTIASSYLPPAAEGECEPSHEVPELSGRARDFATGSLIKHLGHSGIAAMIERHWAVTGPHGTFLGREPGIEIINVVVPDQIILHFGSSEQRTWAAVGP
jgi:hypothetical protein